MDKADFDKLAGVVSKEERIRLTTLYNAAVENLKRYQGEKTKAALSDWEAAEAALESYAGKMEEKYNPSQGPPLKNIMEMKRYLKDMGYQVEKSKLYQDAKKGLFRKNADGSVPVSEAQAYVIKAGLKPKETGGPDPDVSKHHAEKLVEEIKGQQLKNEKLGMEVKRARGELMSIAEAETERAINLAAYDGAVRHLVRTHAHAWVVQAGKDPAKLRRIIEGDLDEMSNELAKRKEIMVEVGG